MITWYYPAMFALSMILTGCYALLWKKHDDIHITLVFVLIPISNLGNLLMASADSRGAALIANAVYYVGGCFLQLVILLGIFSLCRIRVHRWLRMLLLTLSALVYVSALTAGRETWFYRDVAYENVNGIGMLRKEYGPLHIVFYGMIFLYFALSITAIVYSLIRKKQISRKILGLLFLPEAVCMAAFFLGRRVLPEIEMIPAAYVLAQVVYLLITWKLNLYDVTGTVIESMVQTGETGFITFDRRFHYLGSNETARRILPQLDNLTVDLSVRRSRSLAELLEPWLTKFQEHPDDPEKNRHPYPLGDRFYLFTVGLLKRGASDLGYRITITDDTLVQENIRLLKDRESELKEKVEEKTRDIRRMSENLVLSLAVMVESRDNSTGGHIRRTRDGVRILTDAMRGNPPEGYEITEDFCRMLIKAAPMHDLGKIAVDDEILRKPGRFTPEEYDRMKRHAAEGGRIVHEILKDTTDDAFHQLAENVARYHHERWDGSGYPEGLKGNAIPPEARIMAVADVYDALVSKRVYKESLPFDRADAIMTEGMGSQFDPALRDAYQQARPALEEYYRQAAKEQQPQPSGAAADR